jgi:hypothetical protein
MKNLLLSLVVSFGLTACEGAGLPGGVDAVDAEVVGVDADERPCTSWGRVSVCPDGTVGCDAMICISHEPQACPPEPWGCAGIDAGK